MLACLSRAGTCYSEWGGRLLVLQRPAVFGCSGLPLLVL